MEGKFFELLDESGVDLSNTTHVLRDPLVTAAVEVPTSKFIKKWSTVFGDAVLLEKSLDAMNGAVVLKVPLMHIQVTPSHSIFYDLTYEQTSKSFKNELLGDFISVDYHKSIFEKDFEYQLNTGSQKNQLNRIMGSNKFTMEATNFTITFDAINNQWIVENSSERVVYGQSGANGAVKNELTFKNWRGSGSDSSSLQQLPLAWFIAERHSKTFNKSVSYKYKVHEDEFPGSSVKFTSEILLSEVSTNNGDSRVNFDYEVKSYLKKNKINSIKNLVLQNLMVDNHRLKSIAVVTKDYEQVSFYR